MSQEVGKLEMLKHPIDMNRACDKSLSGTIFKIQYFSSVSCLLLLLSHRGRLVSMRMIV